MYSSVLTRIPLKYQETFADESYVKIVRTCEVNNGPDTYRFVWILFLSAASFTVEQQNEVK